MTEGSRRRRAARLIPKDLAMYVGLGGKDWRHSTTDYHHFGTA